MKRRLVTLAAALSLVLCIATVGLWVRSYECTDHVRLEAWEFQSGTGSLVLEWSSMWGGAPFYWADEPEVVSLSLEYHVWHSTHVKHDIRFADLGYAWYFAGSLPVETVVFFVPHWFIAALFAVLPALHLRAAIRSRRRPRVGCCPTCGYDLRATPDCCPECGSVREGQSGALAEVEAKRA